MSLYHEVRGDGPPVLLVHAGIADSRMWAPIADRLAARHTVVTVDLRGFGRTPLPPGIVSNAADLEDLLDELGIERAAVVGASFGGRVALELAVRAPARVGALALLGSSLDAFEYSDELEAFDAAESAALDRGDVEEAVALNVRVWVERPGVRPADEVDPAVRDLVVDMQRAAFDAQIEVDADLETYDPPIAERLGEIAAPALVLVGEHDLPDFHAIAARLAADLPNAWPVVTIERAAHLPALERPDDVAPLLLDFLAGAGQAAQ